MKVSQELKNEFERCCSENFTLYVALRSVWVNEGDKFNKLMMFLFDNPTDEIDNKNQLQFAKWWAGEEEIEVEEELYYLKLPFDYGQYVKIDREGDVFPGDKEESLYCRTKFTLDEIENNEKLRAFEMFKKRVDDDV